MPTRRRRRSTATVRDHRPHRRRDGGADRRLGRRAHHLRHVQGGRSRHGDRRHPAASHKSGGKSGSWRGRHDADLGRRGAGAHLRRSTPLGAEHVPLADAAWPRCWPRTSSRARDQPPFAGLARWTAMPSAPPTSRRGRPGLQLVGKCRPAAALDGIVGPGESGAHLHRRAGARRRRRRAHPGGRRRATATR